MTGAMRRAVSRIDAAIPLDQVRTMDQLVSASVGDPRFRSVVLASLALLALAMASIGTYGVTSYRVAQRTREFGVRLALGATAGIVRRRVLGQALLPILIGVGLGLVASFALTRFISRFLFGVTPLDLPTFIMVPLFLFGVACLATYLPARRATSVDPIVALRVE